jgi:hypothetical protein
MTKLKHKVSQKNLLQYLVDEYILFRRDFLFLPQDTPESLAEKLDKLDYENKDYGQRERRIQAHIVKVDNQWHFEITAEQPVNGKNRKYTPNNSGYSPSATATGIIYRDDDGKTLVEGTVTVAGWKFWLGFSLGLLGIILFTACAAMIDSVWFYGIIPFFLVAIAFLWFQMYQDRNHLFKLIQETVEASYEQHDKAKA